MPQYVNSLDKVIKTYFASVTAEPFEYHGESFKPKPLIVYDTILRGFTCPAGCGGCCPRFSLEYLPFEVHPYVLEEYEVDFNGKKVMMFHDAQGDHQNHHCRNLQMDTGRCGIHGKQPFHCDFELLRFKDFEAYAILGTFPFGRAWNLKRIDGERGALCKVLPGYSMETVTPGMKATRADVVRRLGRLKKWTDHFKLITCLPDVIDYLEHGIVTHYAAFNLPPAKMEL